MKIKQFLLFLLLLTCTLSFGQNYKSAVGLRLGSPVSATYKTFLNESAAVEVYGSFKSYSTHSWFALSGAYQIHKDIAEVDNLQWYYGGGLSIYFWSFDSGFIGDFNSTSIGINGYLGLEYTFDGTPISVSADWVPTFFLNGFGDGFSGGFGSLAVRYVLN
jgi:hypothetical protein